MSSIRVNSQVDLGINDILRGISQLKTEELESFLVEVSQLLARRKAGSASDRESELMLIINQGLPEEKQVRYQVLNAKLRESSLSEAERAELMGLTDQLEINNAARLEAIAELASLRSVPFATLIHQLGLSPNQS